MAKSEKEKENLKSRYRFLIGGFLLLLVLLAVIFHFYNEAVLSLIDTSKDDNEYVAIEDDTNTIKDGIHVRTGFIEATGMQEVINNCTNCHSAKLVIQNRMSKEGWTATIRWMQKTQNLWDLGENEGVIVDYLAKNYGPVKKGRREGLKDIEWYPLK